MNQVVQSQESRKPNLEKGNQFHLYCRKLSELHLLFFFAKGMARSVSRFPEKPTKAFMMHHTPAAVPRGSSSSG